MDDVDKVWSDFRDQYARFCYEGMNGGIEALRRWFYGPR